MMRIAIGSDMSTDLTTAVVNAIQELGHEVQLFGALANPGANWSAVGLAVGEAVANGSCDQGVLFCWTGTGVSIAANKVPGIRAALCLDAPTAAGARQWNDANVLVMSLRSVALPIALEMLTAWFNTPVSLDPDDQACLDHLAAYRPN